MADLKITQLTADTSPTADDLVATVNDPAGTPGNRKVTLADLTKGLALVFNRQGGSATDWSSPGTTTRDTSATKTFIQMGSVTLSGTAGTDVTVTFPTAFSQIPLVFTQVITAGAVNEFSGVNSITTSTFKARAQTSGGTGETCAWFAVGQ
jgi:hypothetical protein